MVKVTGFQIMVPTERSITRNTHVQYQSSSTHCSKVISIVSERRTELQNDRQDKNNMPPDH